MPGTIAFRGLVELANKLRDLPTKLEGKIARPAFRAGAKIIQQAEQQEAPQLASPKPGRVRGLLARSIKVRAMKRKKGRLGYLVSLPAGTSPTFYSLFVVRGHRLGKRTAEQKRAAKNHLPFSDTRQEVPPNPFPQRAFERVKDQAAAAVEAQLKSGIEDALRS